MKKHTLTALILLLALLLGACGLKATPTPKPTPVVPAGGESSGGESGGETAEAAPTTNGLQVPEDVPIMPGAYKLQVLRHGTQIVYQVDGSIDDVLSFYQTELEKLGWQMAGPPDSAVGSIATMLRQNEAGDKLSINMQHNPLGNFVSINIAVVRAAEK